MQIKTLKELQTVLASFEKNRSGDLWVASTKFKYIEQLNINHEFPARIAFSNFGDLDIDRDLFLAFFKNGYGVIFQRFLLDMNIPENGYNDWRLFSSAEEASAYVKPLKWELGAEYGFIDPRRREMHWGLGGTLKCVHVDDELEQAVVKNHKGLHILGIHVRKELTKLN